MVHNFTNIIKAKHHLSLQLIVLHMTLAFLAWDLHEHEAVLMDSTITMSMNARS
jgi:hypothetical protein